MLVQHKLAELLSETTSGSDSNTARLTASLREHHGYVWRCARRFGVSAGSVDDVVQETFIVLSRRLATIEVGKERAFLTQTALKLASNWRRANQRNLATSGNDGEHEWRCPEPNAEQRLDERRTRQLLDRALDTLTQDQRAVLVLADINEFTRVEVAELLGLPVGTVASRLNAARERFEQAVKLLTGSQNPLGAHD